MFVVPSEILDLFFFLFPARKNNFSLIWYFWLVLVWERKLKNERLIISRYDQNFLNIIKRNLLRFVKDPPQTRGNS